MRLLPSLRLGLVAALSIALHTARAASADDAAAFHPHDEFYWLGQINKASDVMLVERNIISPELARTIAASVATTIEEGDRPGADRPNVSGYLKLEQRLVAIGGPDVTRIHSGRSRQDMIATVNRLKLRERLLEVLRQLAVVRQDMQALAARHVDTVIPAYTNGVQAQPITLGHALVAFDAALARDVQRGHEAYRRLDLSPLGAAALGGSSFPIDRKRLAQLLGFAGIVDNTFDANQVASLDVPLEAIDVAESVALTIGALAEDWTLQYHDVHPWLMLRDGDLTGPSSIMPQKRNPYGLVMTRQQASDVVAAAARFRIDAHNLATGMPDYKHGPTEDTLDATLGLLQLFHQVLQSVVIDPAQALAVVNADYATTTELADVLQRDANVPFRVGHHFASDLVTYGRSHGLAPAQLPFDEAQRLYRNAAQPFGITPAELPLSEARFREALTPQNMVASARVTGGPQRAEVERMLADANASVRADDAWLQRTRAQLQGAQQRLDEAFNALAIAGSHR